MSNTSLSARFVAGDPEAVREVYRAYGRVVYGIGYRMLGDPHLAEEVVQQTLLQAWRAAPRFNPDRDLAPWLYTIARRVAVDLYRRERRHRSEELGQTDVAELPVTFEGTWATWQVRQAIESLPPEERLVLRATHYAGLTHDQAATELGIPIGTVKSRSHRAYRRLARLLAHLEVDR